MLLFLLCALLPACVVLLAYGLEIASFWLYSLLKLTMLATPFAVLNLRTEIRPDWPRTRAGVLSGCILTIVPLLFLCLGGLDGLDPEPIREKLIRLGILDWFLPMIAVLSTANAFLEEWYFRGWLLHINPPMSSSETASLNGLVFSLHHLVVLSTFFALPVALFFSFATFVAGWLWAHMRLRGASIYTLFLSHLICDVVILGFGGWLLLF